MVDWGKVANDISDWISDYAHRNSLETLVVGVSGGIDSAVTSTLSAMTGIRTIVVNMPIHQDEGQYDLANLHIQWLVSKWGNVERSKIDLSNTYDELCSDLDSQKVTELSLANSRARLRMTALFAVAGSNNGIVVGTGNKVEDFGIGFYTKYGDGGVDISPIADCTKTEVWELGKELDIIDEIIKAPPTDGLWDDGRSDASQLGMSYDSDEAIDCIEQVMAFITNAAYQASASLAGEKGASSIFNYDDYMQCPFIQEALTDETKQAISDNGIRNIAIMSIAPTGSISNIVLSYQNNGKNYIGVSGGVEPIFAVSYNRRSESFNNETFKVYPVSYTHLTKPTKA